MKRNTATSSILTTSEVAEQEALIGSLELPGLKDAKAARLETAKKRSGQICIAVMDQMDSAQKAAYLAFKDVEKTVKAAEAKLKAITAANKAFQGAKDQNGLYDAIDLFLVAKVGEANAKENYYRENLAVSVGMDRTELNLVRE